MATKKKAVKKTDARKVKAIDIERMEADAATMPTVRRRVGKKMMDVPADE